MERHDRDRTVAAATLEVHLDRNRSERSEPVGRDAREHRRHAAPVGHAGREHPRRVDAEGGLDVVEQRQDHRDVVLQTLLVGEVEVPTRALPVGRDDQEVVAVGERHEVAVDHLLHRVRGVAVEVEDHGHGARTAVRRGNVELIGPCHSLEVELLAGLTRSVRTRARRTRRRRGSGCAARRRAGHRRARRLGRRGRRARRRPAARRQHRRHEKPDGDCEGCGRTRALRSGAGATHRHESAGYRHAPCTP